MATDEEIQQTFQTAASTATEQVRFAKDPNAALEGRPLTPAERRKLIEVSEKEFSEAHQAADLAAILLRQERQRAAQVEFASDIVDSGELTADLLASDQMSRGMTSVEARNKLLPESYRLLGLGQIRQAEVYCRAARLVGAKDPGLELAIDRSKSMAYPNRVLGAAHIVASEAAYTAQRIALLTAKAQFSQLTGRTSVGAEAAVARKMLEYSHARIENRPIRSDAELDLPAPLDHSFKSQNGQLDSRTRGVDVRTPTDATGRPLSGRNA